RRVCVEQHARARVIELSALVHAPIVHRDRDVVKQRVRAREIEIDHPGDAKSLEEDVVAKEVGVYCTLWKALRAVARLSVDFVSQKLRFRGRQKTDDLG